MRLKSKKWQEDGPDLPVEFARISVEGRLTLVLHPKAERVQVLWNYMDIDKLDEAIENLRKREGTASHRIGFVEVHTCRSRCSILPEIKEEIKEWAKEKGVDAVIWTDLPSNFEAKTDKEFNEKNVLDYLLKLRPFQKEKAKEYIVKTPKQITTKIRRAIEKELGWTYENHHG